jgi:DNA polymerase I-like protein with 3'-5' exonuclease and polymerase domains
MRDRELRTEFGRLRQFLGNAADIGKEALDFMIQSAGASLVNRASARIYARLRQEGLSAKFVLQIHDQLVLECPESEAESVKAIVVEEMERPFLYHGKPRRIPVEATIGPDFGAV